MDINIQNDHIASLKPDSIRNFLLNNVRVVSRPYAYIYLWVSHKEYSLDFKPENLVLRKKYTDERFLYEVIVGDNYVNLITEISDAFTEYQMWTLFFTNDKITEPRLYEHLEPLKNVEHILQYFKSVESDVIWVKRENVEVFVKDLING